MASRTTTRPLTADELGALLVTLLAGVKEEPEAKWRKIVGTVEALPIAFHPRCNWRVTPTGTAAQTRAVEQAVEIVRGEHPYVGGEHERVAGRR